MEDKFQDVLNSVNAKAGRSRLEAYGELVDELRRQGLTCRDIAAVLAQKCQFQTPKSAVNNFVRARARRRRNASRRISRSVGMPPPVVRKPATLHSGKGPSDDEVRQRIAALKARKPATASPDSGFYFDPTEPLRLIRSGKEGERRLIQRQSRGGLELRLSNLIRPARRFRVKSRATNGRNDR